MAAAGAPHGTVLIADQQTGGRGRMGRSFSSPMGKGLYLSVILRPDCPASQLMHLTCAAGVAACDAVEKVSGIRPGIKWINDLIWENKKLGGILTELSVEPATGIAEYAVIGIGINCLQIEEDFAAELQDIATSLAIAGKSVDRSELAAGLIRTLKKMSDHLQDRNSFIDTYREDCLTVGKEVQVISSSGIQNGIALDVDTDGGLVVQYADGSIHTVSSGEVSVRGMYGYI